MDELYNRGMHTKNEDLEKAIDEAIENFHNSLLKKLQTLKLGVLLKRKNPYLFVAKGMTTAEEIVDAILSAFLSSSEETIFGNVFFEPIAKTVSGCDSSGAEDIDIQRECRDSIQAISIKSGTSAMNAGQKKHLHTKFMELRSRLGKTRKSLDCVLAYGYGRRCSPATRTRIFREVAGQAFWEEITGDPDFYLKMIDLIQPIAARNRGIFEEELAKVRNRLLKEFTEQFVKTDGSVNWRAITELNSSKT